MIECDFIPARYHEARAFRRSIRVRASGIGVMLAIMMLWIVAHRHRLASADAILREISLQRDQVEINAAKKRTMESQLAGLRDRQHLIDQLSDRVSLVHVFGEISRRQPEVVVLTGLSVRCPSLAAFVEDKPPAADTGSSGKNAARQADSLVTSDGPMMQTKLVLSGIAVSLSDIIQFAAALEKSLLFDGVSMSVEGPTVWAGRQAERFELNCELAPQERDGS